MGGRKEEAHKAEHNTTTLPALICTITSSKREERLGEIQAYLGKATNLFDGYIESEEVERLATHSGKVVHSHGFLFSESQVSVHPHLPLWLWAKLVQTSDLLVGDGGRA